MPVPFYQSGEWECCQTPSLEVISDHLLVLALEKQTEKNHLISNSIQKS